MSASATPLTAEQARINLDVAIKALEVAHRTFMEFSASPPAPAPIPAPASVIAPPATPSIFAPSPRVGGVIRRDARPRESPLVTSSVVIQPKYTTRTVKPVLQTVMSAFHRDHPGMYITKDAIIQAILDSPEIQTMTFDRANIDKVWIPIKTAFKEGRGKEGTEGMYDHNGNATAGTGYRLNQDFYTRSRV